MSNYCATASNSYHLVLAIQLLAGIANVANCQGVGSSSTNGQTNVGSTNQGQGNSNVQFEGKGNGFSVSSTGGGASGTTSAAEQDLGTTSNSSGSFSKGSGAAQNVGQAEGQAAGRLEAKDGFNGTGTIATSGKGGSEFFGGQKGSGVGVEVLRPDGTTSSPMFANGGGSGSQGATGIGNGQGTGTGAVLGSFFGSGNTVGNGFGLVKGNTTNGGQSGAQSNPGTGFNFPAFPGMPELNFGMPSGADPFAATEEKQFGFGTLDGLSSGSAAGVGNGGSAFSGSAGGPATFAASSQGNANGNSGAKFDLFGNAWNGKKK